MLQPKEIADFANVLQDQLGKKFSDAVTNVLIKNISCETSKIINYEVDDKNFTSIAEELEKDDSSV